MLRCAVIIVLNNVNTKAESANDSKVQFCQKNTSISDPPSPHTHKEKLINKGISSMFPDLHRIQITEPYSPLAMNVVVDIYPSISK